VFYLIAEYLDLADGTVHQLAGSIAVVVGVYLEVERDTFHSFLGGEVSAQAIHPNKYLQMGTEIDTACWCQKHYSQTAVGRNKSCSGDILQTLPASAKCELLVSHRSATTSPS